MRTMQTHLSRTLLQATLLLLLGMQTAQAAIHYVSPTGSDANNGLSWSAANATVQAAVSAAISGDEVWVKKGTYSLSTQITPVNGIAIYGGFAGTETALSQRNPATNVTILDGGNVTRHLYIPGGVVCTVDGFTLRNGSAAQGGAIYCDSGSGPYITNNVFSGNAAVGSSSQGLGSYGGAIYSINNSPYIVSNTFAGNSAANTFGYQVYGGAISFFDEGSYSNCDPYIANNTFTGNSSGNGVYSYANGGAVDIEIACYNGAPGGNPTITGNAFQGNTCLGSGGSGGALSIEIYEPQRSNVVSVTNNTFIDNSTSTLQGYGYGGAVYLNGSTPNGYQQPGAAASLNFTGNVVSANSSLGAAGGVYVNWFAFATIADNDISKNSAMWGGGGLFVDDDNGTVTCKDNLIAGNGAGDGAGILWYMGGGDSELVNNTVVDNEASYGGAALSIVLETSNVPTIANNIVAFNTFNGISYNSSGGGPNPPVPLLVTNDVYGNFGSNYSGLAPGTGDLSVDPLFVNHAGGDYHLTAASPLIDAGTDSYVSPGDTDLDGNPRIYGLSVDMGCYEYQPPTGILTGLALSASTVQGGSPLTGTVTLSAPAPSGGAQIALSYTSTAYGIVSGPPTVAIPGGATSATFTINTDGVPRNTTATVSAYFHGVTQSASFTLTPALATLTLASPVILSGGTTTGTVTLSTPAPAGGITGTLTSSNPAAASVPPSITIPAGHTSVTFPVTGGTVTSGQQVVITASRGVNSVSAALLVNPSGIDVKEITLLPSTVVGGQSATGVITLTAPAPAGGLLVPLGSANPAIASVPAYVAVAAGENSASFPITTGGVSTNTTVLIGSGLETLKTATLTVEANAISSLALAPSPAEVGDTVIGVVNLALPAPAGGLTIPLTVNNSALLSVSASVTIPAGQTSGTFYAQALVAGTARVTAKLNGVSTTVSLTITP